MDNSAPQFVPASSSGKTRPNPEYTKDARALLQGKWGLAVGVSFVYVLLTMLPSGLRSMAGLVALLITGPLMLGYAGFSLRIARNETPQFTILFEGFNRFFDAFVTYLLQAIYILLWTLLLIVPGIIAALGYSMTFFILSDNPTMRPTEALRTSKEMMQGHRLQLLYLGLRFVGWLVLSILTLGVGFLFLMPYASVSFARFYEDIKR